MTSHAETIISNAKVLTMDPDRPSADAVALAGNEILAVGSAEAVAELKTGATRMVDAGGNTVVPGFNDAHVHLFVGAAELDNLQLGGVEGFDALKSAMQAFASANPDETILQAQGADYTILGGKRITRQMLDSILPDRPFIMFAADHHTAWANTAALKAADLF